LHSEKKWLIGESEVVVSAKAWQQSGQNPMIFKKTHGFLRTHGREIQKYSILDIFRLLSLIQALVKSKQITSKFQVIGFPRLTRGKTLMLVWSADRLRVT